VNSANPRYLQSPFQEELPARQGEQKVLVLEIKEEWEEEKEKQS